MGFVSDCTEGKKYMCRADGEWDDFGCDKCIGVDGKGYDMGFVSDCLEEAKYRCRADGEWDTLGCDGSAKGETPAKTVVIHEGIREQPGYSIYMSGCCRGHDSDGAAVKIEGKYSKTAGIDGGIATQEECAAACNAESTCLGYCHGNPWCVIYGKGIHLTAEAPWAGDDHENEGPIMTTKPNPTYICAVKAQLNEPDDVNAANELNMCFGVTFAMLLFASSRW